MFDIRSMFLVAALTAFVCMIVLWSMRPAHRPSQDGLTLAAAAQGCMALAMALIAIRGMIPDALSVFTANALGGIGGLLLYDAARRICGQPGQPGFLAVGVLVVVALNGYWGSDPAYHLERICLNSIIQGAIAVAIVRLMLTRRGRDARVPLRWGIAFASVYAAMHLVRLILSLQSGVQSEPGGMVTGNPMIETMAAFFSIAPMIYAMVMIGIVNGRLAYEYRRLATVDSLTGLRSRRAFFDRAAVLLRASRSEPRRVSVAMMLDLDHFKRINDTLGHPAGDTVLINFANRLREATPRDALLGRYGGEEFCVFLTADSHEQAIAVANQICASTSRIPIGNDGARIPVTVSIGMATAPADGDVVADLMMAADRRVYLAKSAGRNRVVASDYRPEAHGGGESDDYVPNDLLPV